MWAALIASLWGPAAPEAYRVVNCESGWDPNNVGPATRYGRAHGLFQIMNGPFEPEANIRLAFALWSQSRWRRWTCKP